jgi:ADP-ribosyltransferase of polymorphic toxin system
MGGDDLPNPSQGPEESAAPAQNRTLFHYTTARGLQGIVADEVLRPSLRPTNPRDVRHGEGQYLSDIVPGTKTPGQLAYQFLNDPRGWRRFTHFVEIDVTGLSVVEGRPGVFVVLNDKNLNLSGRIVNHGEVPRRVN